MNSIINIRGCNASGKSTTVRGFINSFADTEIETIGGNEYTRCGADAYVLGRYNQTSGGCDRYDGKDHVMRAIKTIIEQRHPHIIVYEGMIYSKTAKMAQEIEDAYRQYGYSYKGVYLWCRFSEIIRRLELRNGGRPYNIASVKRTYDACYNSYKNIKAKGLDIIRINMENMSIDDMAQIIPQLISEETL